MGAREILSRLFHREEENLPLSSNFVCHVLDPETGQVQTTKPLHVGQTIPLANNGVSKMELFIRGPDIVWISVWEPDSDFDSRHYQVIFWNPGRDPFCPEFTRDTQRFPLPGEARLLDNNFVFDNVAVEWKGQTV